MKRLLLFLPLALVACTKSTIPETDIKQTAVTEKLVAEAQAQVGMPGITNFQERKQMKMILELRDREDLICYAYLAKRETGEVGQFLGRCLGFGLPYSVQYTSPEKVVSGYHLLGGTMADYSHPIKMPQPDPNGLYMPQGLAATWLMLIDPATGEPRPVYVEPEIIVSPFPLHGESAELTAK